MIKRQYRIRLYDDEVSMELGMNEQEEQGFVFHNLRIYEVIGTPTVWKNVFMCVYVKKTIVW